MSRPSSPAASRARCAASLAIRASALAATSAASRARHDADAVVVGHDHVARVDRRSGADDRHVDRAERLLDRALREHRLRPDREAHRRQVRHVADAGVDHQPAAPARRRRGRKQLAEVAVLARARRGEDQEVAGPHLLDRHVQHPVVAGRRRDRDRRPGDPRARIDRPQVAGEEPGPPLRLMHRRDAAAAEPVDHARVGARDGLHHHAGHQSSSTVRGNTDWNPSAWVAARPPAWPPEFRMKWLARFSATSRVVVPEVLLPLHALDGRAASSPRPARCRGRRRASTPSARSGAARRGRAAARPAPSRPDRAPRPGRSSAPRSPPRVAYMWSVL